MSKLGDGSRFKKVAGEAGGGKEGAAIAAIEGRKKYGESKMEKWSEAGKKKHEMASKMAKKEYKPISDKYPKEHFKK